MQFKILPMLSSSRWCGSLPQFFLLFFLSPQHPRYLGGEIMVDSLEGATVVNPEYYTQSEQVPGSARLRVRVFQLFFGFFSAKSPFSGG